MASIRDLPAVKIINLLPPSLIGACGEVTKELKVLFASVGKLEGRDVVILRMTWVAYWLEDMTCLTA